MKKSLFWEVKNFCYKVREDKWEIMRAFRITTNAIEENQARIEELEKRIEELESKK